MNIQIVDIKSVILNPTNPRTIKDDKFRKLIQSIKDFPQMLNIRPIVVDNENIVLGGNMRLRACIEAGLKEIPIIKASELTDEQKKQFIVKDNIGYGDWDFDLLLEDWTKEELTDWGLDIPKQKDYEISIKLNDKFIIPPMSILDTRQGYWQERKAIWNEYLKEEGASREETLGKEGEAKYGHLAGRTEGPVKGIGQSVSLFDPVLAEVIFHWFAPEGGSIIDPFAGDIRKGGVAGFIGHTFTGIELRKEQVEINKSQIERLNHQDKVKYINDDGTKILNHIKEDSQDLLFSCPPYYDLETYSKLPDDASNQETYEDFIKIIDEALTDGIKCLKDNRFAVIVVGDLRRKDGYYYNFHEDIKYIFQKSGMRLYNELILIESGGSAALRANNAMKSRKQIKTHQNVLVFYKPEENHKVELESVYRKVLVFYRGDTKKIKENFRDIEYKNVDLPEPEGNIDEQINKLLYGDDE